MRTKPQMINRTYPHTKLALEVYDAGAQARTRSWAATVNQAQIGECAKADRQALMMVQDAFHKDTHDINSHHQCLTADVAYMRRIVAESEKQ